MTASRTTASLARGAAISTAATAASRVTGFVRVIVVAAAMGTTFLANTYQTANTAPNVVFELVAAGVLTSVFVPTFVDFIVRGEREKGWEAANAMTSVALVGLVGISLVLGLAAPWIMRLLTLGVRDDGLRDDQIALGATFLRLFAPQVIFYGAGMIMTGALHAHRRFGLPAIAPIFNNIVVIGVYLTYAAMRGDGRPSVSGVTSGETFLLGAGTTAGVVAMTVCLIPQLRRLGWRWRFHFDPAHPAVRKALRLGVWALGYAGGYQAGLIVVLLLANRVEGGVAAYQWAYTFFYLPHALFAVPIFNVMFTAMSEHAAKEEEGALIERLGDGLAMLAFLLIPIAALMIAVAEPLARTTLEYGVMTTEGSEMVGRVIGAFAFGLPTYSAFLVFTRAFYALGDARPPTVANALSVAASAVAGAAMFVWFSEEWAVAGLALGHSIGFAIGAVVLARALRTRLFPGPLPSVSKRIVRSCLVSLGALAAMAVVSGFVPDASTASSLANVLVTAVVGAAVYVGAMHLLGSIELKRITALVTGNRS